MSDLTEDELRAVMETAKRVVLRDYPTKDRLDREDVNQEVMIKYLNTWDHEHRPENDEAWLTTAIKFVVIDRIRLRGRRFPAHLIVDAENAESISDFAKALADAAQQAGGASKPALNEKVLRLVFNLVGPDDSELLRAAYVDNVPAVDLAAREGVPANTMHRRLGRARARMADALQGRPDLVDELRRAERPDRPRQV